MARLDLRLPQNVPGEFFVDSTCIDCDTCWQIAPQVFVRSDDAERAVVHAQPKAAEDRMRAGMALVACPTASIGTLYKIDFRLAARQFPELIEEEVYYCGFAAEASFGASSYLIRRPQGNVLVDSPRAAGPLLERLRELGGVRWMFLSHRDDVADHARFRKHFGCERIMHRADIGAGTRDVERPLDGREPLRLDDELLVIPLPGHTRGSAALLYRDRFLFTGDHLWGADGQLEASRSVCWYSWPEQMRSMERLLNFRFEWVLPGHGRRFRAAPAETMRAELEQLIRRMRRSS